MVLFEDKPWGQIDMKSKEREKRIKLKPGVIKAVILFLSVYFVYLFFNQSMTHLGLIEDKEELKTEMKEVEKEVKNLETKLDLLQDEEHLERLAREELRVIGSDEVLIDVRPLMAEDGKVEDGEKNKENKESKDENFEFYDESNEEVDTEIDNVR